LWAQNGNEKPVFFKKTGFWFPLVIRQQSGGLFLLIEDACAV
jgi:hypothetical protein